MEIRTRGQKSHQPRKLLRGSVMGIGDWLTAKSWERHPRLPQKTEASLAAASHGRETIPSLGYTTAETCLDQEPTSKTWLYVMPRLR